MMASVVVGCVAGIVTGSLGVAPAELQGLLKAERWPCQRRVALSVAHLYWLLVQWRSKLIFEGHCMVQKGAEMR